MLSPTAMDRRQREIPEWWPQHIGAELDQYLAYVRTHIHADAVATLWATASVPIDSAH